MRVLGSFINFIPVSLMVEVLMILFFGCSTLVFLKSGHYLEFFFTAGLAYLYIPRLSVVEYNFARGGSTWKMAIVAMGLSLCYGLLAR